MTDEIERVAKGLTKAQRDAVLRMEIGKPPLFMPTYHSVKFFVGVLSSQEVEQLQTLGLVTLPIATGGRGSPTYCGEIHELGLAVRRHLQEKAHD